MSAAGHEPQSAAHSPHEARRDDARDDRTVALAAPATDSTPDTIDGVAIAHLYGEPLWKLPTDLYIPPDALAPGVASPDRSADRVEWRLSIG